jgi:hypothetical protein
MILFRANRLLFLLFVLPFVSIASLHFENVLRVGTDSLVAVRHGLAGFSLEGSRQFAFAANSSRRSKNPTAKLRRIAIGLCGQARLYKLGHITFLNFVRTLQDDFDVTIIHRISLEQSVAGWKERDDRSMSELLCNMFGISHREMETLQNSWTISGKVLVLPSKKTFRARPSGVSAQRWIFMMRQDIFYTAVEEENRSGRNYTLIFIARPDSVYPEKNSIEMTSLRETLKNVSSCMCYSRTWDANILLNRNLASCLFNRNASEDYFQSSVQKFISKHSSSIVAANHLFFESTLDECGGYRRSTMAGIYPLHVVPYNKALKRIVCESKDLGFVLSIEQCRYFEKQMTDSRQS